jgi:cellulose synthase/poly-beta-1,6-N-acetylglucosamine synthase-like glycosyltransferase
MIGPFGGCYTLRSDYYEPVPKGYLVDDFYITMNVLEAGKSAVLSINAICLEDVSTKLSEEFRRKVRMSQGNFQNLERFSHLMTSKRKGLAFSFISHKVFRWITPIAIIFNMFTAYALIPAGVIYIWMFWLHMGLMSVAIFESSIVKKLGGNIKLLRFISYFYNMNMALLVGLFRFATGKGSGTWEPTERNQ